MNEVVKVKRSFYLGKVLSYEGVIYHHLGRSKWGIDCAGLPIKSMLDCGVQVLDLMVYTTEGDGILLSSILSQIGQQKNIKDIKPGDTLLLKFFRHPQHIAVYLGDYYNNGQNYIIHASDMAEKVVIENFKTWESRVVGVYEFSNFED